MRLARLPKFALLMLVTLAVSACGTRVIYDRMDSLLYFHLSSQVSLDDGQARALRASLRDLHSWHRSAALPAYAQFLETLADDMAQPIGTSGIDAARAGMEALWRDTVAGAAPLYGTCCTLTCAVLLNSSVARCDALPGTEP